jgi:hypothetical protein
MALADPKSGSWLGLKAQTLGQLILDTGTK